MKKPILQKSWATWHQQSDNLIAQTTQGLDAHNTKSLWGRRHDIQLLYHARQITNTTFRDRRPGIPPLELEPQCHMAQPAAQAT
jgi:hypothetical protein